jgi:hypothetical protein
VNRRILYAVSGLLAIAILYYAGGIFFGSNRSIPPSELAQRALTAGSAVERERAALDLAGGNASAIAPMREVLAKTESPQVKSYIIQGLGAQRDWDSMPALIDALDDPAIQVRDRAGVAVNAMLGVDYYYKANDPAPKREAAVKLMRQRYKSMLKSPPPFAKGMSS